MCKDCGVSNPPLGVPWLVVITDSNLCHHWDLQTLKHMLRPWHAVSWRERKKKEGREDGGREGWRIAFLETVNISVLSLHPQFWDMHGRLYITSRPIFVGRCGLLIVRGFFP